MTSPFLTNAQKSIAIELVRVGDFASWLKKQSASARAWLGAQEFEGKAGKFCIIPNASGGIEKVVAGLSDTVSIWDLGDMAGRLPKGAYHLSGDIDVADYEKLIIGWGLGAYRFVRYKKQTMPKAQLVMHSALKARGIESMVTAINHARDLINTPAEDMGPAELADYAMTLAKKYSAKASQIVGNDLIKKKLMAIHTVGRASSRAPRLVDFTWRGGNKLAVTLVGKGVCFDTGGLDIKPSSGMYFMKKDMGGAAVALAIAEMVMAARLPITLRVLIPAVENSISGNAFRPTDVIKMRNGLTVEVGNTDAEGRLVLADAFALANEDKPDMILDFATLTGAARTAVGTEISALFANDDALADSIQSAAAEVEDAVCRLPLYAPYNRMLESPVADLNSCPNSGYAGAITAALFLQHFIDKKCPWAHFDMMAWNLSGKPGRPEGGEAMAARAVFRMLETRCAKNTGKRIVK